MCNPALAMAGFQAIGTAIQIRSQNALASARASAMASGATSEALAGYSMVSEQQRQVGMKTAQDITMKLRQALRTRSMLRVASAESGVTTRGERQEVAVGIETGENIGVLQTNRENAISQLQLEKVAIARGAQVRLDQAKELLESRTPPWLAALQIASAGISGYAQGRSAFGPAETSPRAVSSQANWTSREPVMSPSAVGFQFGARGGSVSPRVRIPIGGK